MPPMRCAAHKWSSKQSNADFDMQNPIKEWQKGLLSELGKLVAMHGFAPKPSGQSFRRATAAGWVSFHVAFIEHGNTDFDLTADVAVRIDAVETLVTADSKLLTKSEREQTATLGCEIGNLTQGKPLRWSIASAVDVTPAAAGVADSFVNVALPYFEKYSDLEVVYETLRKNDSSGWLHSPVDDARCKRAIALAKVLNRRGDLPALIEQSTAFLRANKSAGLGAFLKLAEKLSAEG